ncbi:GNAT family N-acetyltransferase [Bacillus sp. FJAT-49736]|uniref:GNAT family N-acetyltransferase n=1 Tax=Bacillus sp. FJAT-49736 TaxID=2833582 RepID=UPI001BC9EC2F|nr:GNAT family N-acetyltransferase [Bacillus sp. FJAT-49736]MBS4172816.1 GNAT family N-acetyltransferase [Bacillus sp. FJAT-49736]
MNITLIKATEIDAQAIFDLQVKAFMPLLEKYKDYGTNPANETVERVLSRINDPNGSYYKIIGDEQLVGAIRVHWKVQQTQLWISPIFIDPDFQGKGIAQKTILLMEKMNPEAITWELSTILEEKRNCHVYEKLGFELTGISKKINSLMTLVDYKKSMEKGNTDDH